MSESEEYDSEKLKVKAERMKRLRTNATPPQSHKNRDQQKGAICKEEQTPYKGAFYIILYRNKSNIKNKQAQEETVICL